MYTNNKNVKSLNTTNTETETQKNFLFKYLAQYVNCTITCQNIFISRDSQSSCQYGCCGTCSEPYCCNNTSTNFLDLALCDEDEKETM